MEKYYHNYQGIIVQNDDPDMMGRVKVWVPHVNMTLYKQWNDDREVDKNFTELGGNLNSGLTPELLLRLKNSLPWGKVKQPIFGMGTSTTYHSDKNFGEIANDADNSAQHAVINKLPSASLPQNNNFESLGKAMATTGASTPPDSSKAINNYSNPSKTSSALDYVKNSITPPKSESLPTTQTGATAPAGDNISKIVITFTPNSRNASNTHRRFNTGSSICDSAGCLTGSAQALGQFNSFTNTFTSPGTPTTVTPTSYSPPITYTPSSVTVNAGETPVSRTVAPVSTPVVSPVATTSSPTTNRGNFSVLTASANATTQPNTRVSNDNGDFIQITFTPNSRNANNTHRRFTTSSSLVSYSVDSGDITINDGRTTVINTSAINDISVVYDQEGKAIDLNSARLGQLAGLTSQYSNNASAGIPAAPISPPAPMSEPKPNRGGGGGELFGMNFANILPFGVLLNTLVGNTNPDSKMSTNYKRPLDNGTDPNKTKGSNQQKSADCGPPFRSPTQSNKAKGMISIPAVGAHVSVYFEDGDPQFPIVDGVFYTQEAMAGIHDATPTTDAAIPQTVFAANHLTGS